MKGSQGSNLGAGTDTEAVEECCLRGLPLMACSACGLFVLSTQNYLSRGSTTHSGLGPSTTIINQEDDVHTGNLTEASFQLKSLFQMTLARVKLTET